MKIDNTYEYIHISNSFQKNIKKIPKEKKAIGATHARAAAAPG